MNALFALLVGDESARSCAAGRKLSLIDTTRTLRRKIFLPPSKLRQIALTRVRAI
jgi:hypothetical protein